MQLETCASKSFLCINDSLSKNKERIIFSVLCLITSSLFRRVCRLLSSWAPPTTTPTSRSLLSLAIPSSARDKNQPSLGGGTKWKSESGRACQLLSITVTDTRQIGESRNYCAADEHLRHREPPELQKPCVNTGGGRSAVLFNSAPQFVPPLPPVLRFVQGSCTKPCVCLLRSFSRHLLYCRGFKQSRKCGSNPNVTPAKYYAFFPG